MAAPSALSEQVIAAPSGAGAVRSAGETFRADPYTGTGRTALPIATEPGPAGIMPALSLSYSTHGGNGIAGLGWSLGLASVARRTDRGIPVYDDAVDTFALQGDELLSLGAGQYRLRTEGRFARVRHVTGRGRDFWVVTERDGTRTFYGESAESRLSDGGSRIAVWQVTRKQDVHGNEVRYRYERDSNTNDTRLVEVLWGPYRLELLYDKRPDPIASSRMGFRHTVTQRLSEIRTQVLRTDTGVMFTYRRLRLSYTVSAWTGRSLLSSATPSGIDAAGQERALPAVTFGWEGPAKVDVRWHTVSGDVPGVALGADVTLVRQSGSGLPDVLETRDHAVTLRVNLGGARFARAVAVSAPSRLKLSDKGSFLSDMDGDGYADWVTDAGSRTYKAVAGGGFVPTAVARTRPSLDLDDPRVRVVDLDADGLPDVLQATTGGLYWFENRGDGQWAPPVKVADTLPVRLDDPRTALVDIDGDGIPDLVYADGSGVLVWPGLGRGRFGPQVRLEGAPALGASFDPSTVRWVDVCGSGQASLVIVQGGVVRVAFNQAGRALSPLVEVGRLRQSSRGQVEGVDLLGTGALGLLFTDRADAGPAWRFLELFPKGQPDLLTRMDNGIGGRTELGYGGSGAHWARDLASGRPWKTRMPVSERVVDRVTVSDSVTGSVLRTEYRYHHGVYDSAEREFRGFAFVETRDVEAPVGDVQPLAPVVTKRWTHTGVRLDHSDEWTPVRLGEVADEVPGWPDAQYALRGQVRREEVFALDRVSDRPYVVNSTSYRVFPVGRSVLSGRLSYAALPVYQRAVHIERTDDVRIVEVRTTYDLHSTSRGYGLPVEVREKALGRQGTFSTAHEQQQTVTHERYTKTTYVNLDSPEADDTSGAYVPVYITGKPSVTERYGVTGSGDVLLSKVRTFYDGIPYQGLGYPGSGTSIGLTKGLVSCQLELCFTSSSFLASYPVGSGATAAAGTRGQYLQDGSESYRHTERYAYTSTGMVSSGKDPNGNLTTVTYEGTHGLFPTLVTDALSHPTTLTRGVLPLQVAALMDANDNRTEFVYDPTGLPAARSVMGKFVASAWQGDPATHPTEAYEYDFSTLPIRVTTKARQVRLGATADVHRYIDGLGRTVQERHTAEPDAASPGTPRFRVTGWQVYNHKGLVVRAYQPVFSTSSVYATGNTGVPYLETLYDPLGRPLRVNHPDGTYETTDYHPWVQTARDRNDNAGALTFADPRYGAHLATFRSHLNTPTRTYTDALGRSIAVSEDNGAGNAPALRVTTYEIRAGAFTGTTYDLVLKQDLLTNYFVMIRGTVNNTAPTLGNHGVRVTHDPLGTGDLNTVGATNKLRLTRNANSQGDWQGTVVVVESVADPANAGFTLVDVKTVSFAQLTTGGQPQTVNATANVAWTDLSRVCLYGGPRGGGSSSTSTVATMHHALHSALTPSGTNSITGTRWRTTGTFPAADFTTYVVQWGSEHSLQRVTVTGTAGGDGVDIAGEWNTASITAVRTSNSWVWASGWTKAEGAGNSFNGVVLALGNGLTVPDVATTVAVGCETSIDKSVVVTVHSHPGLLVHWLRKADGDATVNSYAHAVTLSGESETYDAVSNPRTTVGLRAPHHTHTLGITTNDYAQGTFFTRHTADGMMTASRLPAAPNSGWVAWVQSVETVGVRAPVVASPELHVTRSVLDLKDQVLQVYDARNLGFATWTFAYDLAGQRTSAVHATGTGSRWSLFDAAGNPIWSRDARSIEVDRTFDGLHRPLTEESDDGSVVKLRRKWTYVPYNAGDSTSKSKNLFGRVEEERDTDGLRYFEYDWRGLVTKVSHQFWDGSWQSAAWTLYGNADEAAIPSAARSSLSTWLVLTGLTDTTTVAVTTSYDAAGRPLEEAWPAAMKRRWTYNAAGTLEKVEYDRGAGAGYEVGVQSSMYNARGQLTGYTHGNNVVCTREYDATTERLTRLFARKTVGGEVRFQDLAYAYDPVGNPVQLTDQLATSSFTSNLIVPNTRTFRYDPRYRLIRSTGKRHKNATDGLDAPVVPTPALTDYVPYTHRYSYDAVGNFTTNQEYKSGTNNLKYKAGAPDLFDGFGAESYNYDANGCCTSTPRHQTMGYSFDAQPVFVDMGGNTKVRYRRHGDQRTVRFVTKSGGVSALGVYLGPWEYHRREGGTAYVKTVLHVEAKGRCAQTERVLSGTDPFPTTVFHVHADHLGSAQALTKVDGTLLAQEEFFAYGRSSDRRDAKARYRYIGVEKDEDTGLAMTGPRAYDPVLGRFLQRDSLAVRRGELSPFHYASGNPVGRSDPGGYDDGSGALQRQEEQQQLVDDAKAAVPEGNLAVIGLGLLSGGIDMMADQLEGIESLSPTPESSPAKYAASGTARRIAAGLEDFARERAAASTLPDPQGLVDRSQTLGYYGSLAAQFLGPVALENGLTRIATRASIVAVESASGAVIASRGVVTRIGAEVTDATILNQHVLPNRLDGQGLANEFVFDPDSNTFLSGAADPRGHRGLFAMLKGANPDRVVGGGLVPGKNGLITTEFSGHYGRNWTPAIREQFQDFLTTRGVNLQHQPHPGN